jgi:hypothetical protein
MLFTLLAGSIAAQSTTISVNTDRVVGQIDPTLFSLVNYQELLDKGESVGVLAIQRLGLEGTMQRLATAPHLFMPEPGVVSSEDLFASESRRYLGLELVEETMDAGMDPVLLLAYNVPWLSPDGDITQAPTDPRAWAELAERAVTSVNGEPGPGYELRVKFVEIWNEPDTPIYWQGSAEQYYELFRLAAAAIKAKHPEVKVGGPVAINYMLPWTRNFIRECRDSVDFLVYHTYNEPVDQLVTRARQMAELFRKETGRTDAQIMITETDNFWLTGEEKIDYLIRRQLAFQEIRDDVDGLHQFQAKAYAEGDRVFGMVNLNGSVVPHNYWPYWIMRDLRGDQLDVEVARGGRTMAMAGRTANTVSTLVYEPLDGSAKRVSLQMSVPADFRDGMLLISSVGAGSAGIAAARPIGGADRIAEELDLAPGQAVAVTVRREAGDDLVWAALEFSSDRALVGQALEATITMRNITTQPVQGIAQVLGVPQEWRVEAIDGSDRFRDLAPGAVHTARFTIETREATPEEGSGAYAFVSARPSGRRSVRMSSVATSILVEAPVAFLTKPELVYTTAGYEAELRVYVTNTYSETISGTLRVDLPEGVRGGDEREITIPRGETVRADFLLESDSGTEQKNYAASVVFDFQGNAFTHPVDVIVTEFPTGMESTIVNLAPFLNVDGASSLTDFGDFDQEGFGGRFALPAQFMPDEGENRYLGVTFDFPSTADGALNLVEARGQTIPLPGGRHDWLYLLTTTVNSSKGDEEMVVRYADGAETIPFQVTDWCVQPKYGDIPIMRSPYRHIEVGILKDCRPQIFLIRLPLDSSREVVSVTLPETRTLYFTSMTLARE